MNLFDNILAKANPLPDVKSQFMSGFQQPQQKKPSMTLFSDEYTMLGKMKADWLSDEESMNLLKQRRTDLLEWRTNLDPKEQSMLLKMQADKLSAKEATALLKQRRADQFEKKYQEWNLLQKWAYNTLMAWAGNLETVLKYWWNALDFVTFWQLWFWEDVKRMEQVTQSPEFDSTAFKAWTYLPDVALWVSPIGAGYLAWAKTMWGLALRSGVVGAWCWAAQPILEQWSDVSAWDIATWAAVGAWLWVVATPVLAKTFKYWKAWYYGGLEWAWKSIARDVKAWVQAITPSGANISTKANRFNASEIRNFIKMTGQTPWDFATSRGMTKVWDDAVVEATNLWQASKDQADEALKAIKWRFRFTDGGEDLLKTTLDDLETRLVNTKSPDAKRISQLKAKYESSGLTMSEINEVKRAYSNNYKYSFVDAGSEWALRSRNLQDAIRKWQFKVAEENGFTNLKDINKTTQWWKAFADSLAKKIQGSSWNNAVSLTDWIALSGGNPENIALYLGKKLATSDRTKALAIKLFSKKTKPSIIQASKADIQQANFQKNVNRGVSGIGDNSGGKSLVRPVGLLPPPSGKATWARNFRANQPTEKQTGVKERVNKEKVKRPWTASRQEASIEKKLVEARERENMLKNVKNDITSATKAARYGWTWNTRVEAVIDAKLAKWEITQQEALSILDDVKTNPRYEYIDQKALDKYIEKIKGGKVESFDELIAPKPQPKEIVTKTHKQIYDKLNQMANDWRYGDKSWNDLADEFKKVTGKDIMDTSFDDFWPDGMLKPPKKVVAPKQFKMKNDRDIDWLENYINKWNKKYNFYEFSENQYMFKSKNNELLEVRTDNNWYITSKKILGELDSDWYLKTKNTKATPKKVVAPKKSTKGIVAPKKIENTPIVKKEAVKPNERSYNLIAVNERTWEKTILTKTPTTQDKAITMKNKFSDREWRRIQLEEVTPKPIVKNLQKTEKSATIGDMETKKLATPEELLTQFTGRDKPEINLSNLKKASPYWFSLEKVGIDKIKHNIRLDDFENPTESIGKIKWIIEQYKKDWKIKPIILDKNGNVLDGNHRINAYKKLWIKEIPVYFPVLSDIKKIDNLATRLLKQNQSLDSYFSDSSIIKNLP